MIDFLGSQEYNIGAGYDALNCALYIYVRREPREMEYMKSGPSAYIARVLLLLWIYSTKYISMRTRERERERLYLVLQPIRHV